MHGLRGAQNRNGVVADMPRQGAWIRISNLKSRALQTGPCAAARHLCGACAKSAQEGEAVAWRSPVAGKENQQAAVYIS